jgi:hypothetical protein
MRYKYTIVGRTPGNINYTTYGGTIEATKYPGFEKPNSNPWRGLVIIIFDKEFGEHDYAETIKEADFSEDGGKITGYVDTGEFTFDVEITEIGDEQPFPATYDEFKKNHEPLIKWCSDQIELGSHDVGALIDGELVEALENGMKYIFEDLDASDVLEHYIQQSKDGCKGWHDMSREQLLKEIWNTHGNPYANNTDRPTWVGFLKHFE